MLTWRRLHWAENQQRAHRVDEGDETEHRCQSQLQQTNIHEQNHEHNGNAQEDIHTAYGLPLQGEQEVCASGETNKVETDGLGGQMDALSWYRDAPSIQTDTIMTVNAQDIISIPQKRMKPPDSPVEAAKQRSNEPYSCRIHVDTLSMHMDMHSIRNSTEMATNKGRIIRTHQMNKKMQNSHNGQDIVRSYLSMEKGSTEDVDVYALRNTLIEVLGTTSRKIAFGQVESGVEAIAPSIEAERVGDGDGN